MPSSPLWAGTGLALSLAVVVLLAATPMPANAASSFSLTTSQATSASACAVVGSRLFVFGGYTGNSGSTSTSLANGVYSIDVNKTIATGSAADFKTHGTVDSSLAGMINQVALVQSNNKVFLAGGIRMPTTSSPATDVNKATYVFDPSAGSTSTQSTTLSLALKHTIQQSAAVADGSSKLYLYGGVALGNITNLSWLAVVNSGGVVANSNITSSGPPARQLGSMGRLNSTHLYLSGGFVDTGKFLDDMWLLEESSRTFTSLDYSLYHARYQHRTLFFDDRYIIHIGGFSSSSPYTLIEYLDVTLSVSQAGTIVNPSNGPKSLVTGCAYLEGNVIVYVGGRQTTNDLGLAEGPFASFLNLLQILPQTDGSLQFKWVTGTASSTSRSGGTSSTPSTTPGVDGPSTPSSSSFGTGAIVGIVVGVLVAAAVVLFVMRNRIRSNRTPRPVLESAPLSPPLMAPVAPVAGTFPPPPPPQPSVAQFPPHMQHHTQQPQQQQPFSTLPQYQQAAPLAPQYPPSPAPQYPPPPSTSAPWSPAATVPTSMAMPVPAPPPPPKHPNAGGSPAVGLAAPAGIAAGTAMPTAPMAPASLLGAPPTHVSRPLSSVSDTPSFVAGPSFPVMKKEESSDTMYLPGTVQQGQSAGGPNQQQLAHPQPATGTGRPAAHVEEDTLYLA
ncbi:hypothetical protein AMAG_11171 [Allomyces macrogynus ATCC 38327]|uniref:Uncharacterized protein n=1 Tax=Allomyces macrogynus (strain ATCC 38327) TaxID=578462 RepID=A0A0L0SSM2_ALLM3|nr:hypothetical protein AMAG_11171 [Allomyces macrogynus ATCC 38327]|eukprot:KNE65558.1 hypothetical protein AMAG_11171 [Allomyces macrogynus ATCC 38327]